MHFDSSMVPSWLCWAAWVIMAVASALAACFAPWRLLLRANERQHLFFGAVVVLVVIWMMSVTIEGIFTFHLLLIASAVLLLGLSFGVLAALLALIIRQVLSGGDWATIGIDALCTVLVPALVPVLANRLVRRIRVAPLFAFTLGAGFLGGGFSIVAAALATMVILALSGQLALLSASWGQIGLLPLLMFSEGFINGTLMTALAVFHPEWVRSFVEPE